MGKPNVSDHNGGATKPNGHQVRENSPRTASSLCNESPKLKCKLTEIVYGAIITDKLNKQWRIGEPIGKGSFGEIFLASDDVHNSVTCENAKYVVKIEPHSNGPLFVEIHCLMNTARNSENNPLPPGMPEFIAAGSHYFKDKRYRFLIIKRFDRDLHSVIKNRSVDTKSLLILAVQILDVLQYLHDKGYCHSDIKAENLMISRCTFDKCTKTADEHTSNDGEDDVEEFKRPAGKKQIQRIGSRPVRSCRSTKQDLLTTRSLRSTKRVNYSKFFCDDNSSSSKDETFDEYLAKLKLTASSIQTSIKDRSGNHCSTEDRIILIDFGLASKFIYSNGSHRLFCTDQRRAHDGTLEFTSRDAHLGAHSRRSDLECLGYNLIFWSQGYLPWKECAAKKLFENVHWMKEYLMKDVKEMLKIIYGESVPKFLGEYMQYVDTLAYNERPNYERCKQIFEREFEILGYKNDKMVLDVNEMIKNAVGIKEARENNNAPEMQNKSIMRNSGILMPLPESNSNRVLPRNLRSSSKDHSNKQKFSLDEVILTNKIAHERAEKEFEREQTIETPPNRYNGKPTYAIAEIENKFKFKNRPERYVEPEDRTRLIKGHTKPMMVVLKKIQAQKINGEKKQQNELAISNKKPASSNEVCSTRSLPGLRPLIKVPRRPLEYEKANIGRRTKRSNENSSSQINSKISRITTTKAADQINNVTTATTSTATPTINKQKLRRPKKQNFQGRLNYSADC